MQKDTVEYHCEMVRFYDELSDEAERRGHIGSSLMFAQSAQEHRMEVGRLTQPEEQRR